MNWLFWLELLTGQVSIGNEYWSVISSIHVIIENEGPCICSRRASLLVFRWLFAALFKPPLLSVKNYKLLRINEMSWSSGMYIKGRITLIFRRARASLLTETSFKGLFCFPYIGFSTTRSFAFEPINKVGLFVSRRFIFYMYKSVTKFIDGLESRRYTERFVDALNSFRDTCTICDCHQSTAFICSILLIDFF